MDLLQDFKDYIKKEQLFQLNDKLLLAVSGGVDSVVLCELCFQANIPFAIAHCNFQLREEESERDEQFVTVLAKKYDIILFVKRFDTEKYATENKLSIQVAARELRYNWFNQLIVSEEFTGNNKNKISGKILTAHHADDNIETLLMNFFKGTGINGLKGILPKQGNLIRPLLFTNKEALLQFAESNGLSFVEDSSNSSDKYTRNYFRNQLIPMVQSVFPKVAENLKDNLQRFREIEQLYTESISQYKKKLLVQKGKEWHIPVLKLKKVQPLATIVYEIIHEFNFTAHQTDAVIGLLDSESGKYIKSSTHRILKNRNWLIINLNELSIEQNILIEGIEGIEEKVSFKDGNISINLSNILSINNSLSIAKLDFAHIKFPLLLRRWKQGDYFYPLGMQKKKKVSRFLIDQKLSLAQKEKIWVIEMNKKIVWVVGMRIDDRFKITGSTKEVLQIELTVPE